MEDEGEVLNTFRLLIQTIVLFTGAEWLGEEILGWGNGTILVKNLKKINEVMLVLCTVAPFPIRTVPDCILAYTVFM